MMKILITLIEGISISVFSIFGCISYLSFYFIRYSIIKTYSNQRKETSYRRDSKEIKYRGY